MEEFQRIILVHYHEIGLKGRNRGVFEKRLQKNLEALLGCVSRCHHPSASPGACSSFCGREPRLRWPTSVPMPFWACPAWPAHPAASSATWTSRSWGSAACIALAEADPSPPSSVRAAQPHGVPHRLHADEPRHRGGALRAVPREAGADEGPGRHRGRRGSGGHRLRVRAIRPRDRGLPVGSSGKVVCLLSSGIDSPVATWRLARRGAVPIGVHFSGRPQTSDASEYLVDDIAHVLERTGASGASTWCPSATTSARYPSPVRRLCGSSCTGASCSAWPRSWRGGKGLARW